MRVQREMEFDDVRTHEARDDYRTHDFPTTSRSYESREGPLAEAGSRTTSRDSLPSYDTRGACEIFESFRGVMRVIYRYVLE